MLIDGLGHHLVDELVNLRTQPGLISRGIKGEGNLNANASPSGDHASGSEPAIGLVYCQEGNLEFFRQFANAWEFVTRLQ